MEVYIARQPIFNKKQKVKAYELLCRDGLVNRCSERDGNRATSKLLSNSFLGFGIQQLTGGKRAFVNFTRELLLEKVPCMFPSDILVVEILEDIEPDKEVINACKEIKDLGYDLALDDFVYKPSLVPLIELSSVIKLDFRVTPKDLIKHYIDKLVEYRVKFLAEKIETYDEFKEAVEMGFHLFQGYFFSKPHVFKEKDIAPSKLNLLRIMAEVNKEGFKFEELDKLIKRDVSISYKLLRYINSAYFRRLKEISSIKQAIVLLGEVGIKRFLSLITMTRLASNKPDELIRSSVIRARFCELLGKGCGAREDISELFTLGLFSLIDAILDSPMELLMNRLPLSDDLKKALISRQGKLSPYLELVCAYEAGKWDEISQIARDLGISELKLPEYYIDSVVWSDSYASI